MTWPSDLQLKIDAVTDDIRTRAKEIGAPTDDLMVTYEPGNMIYVTATVYTVSRVHKLRVDLRYTIPKLIQAYLHYPGVVDPRYDLVVLLAPKAP